MPALLRKIVAVLVISLVFGACTGGGDGGSTWFNLPSVPIRVDANGNGTALGFCDGGDFATAHVGPVCRSRC